MKSSRSNCLHSKSVFLFCPNPATKLPEYPIYNWEGYEYFVNAGAFTKIQSTNTTTISVAFTNSGSVVAQNGTISFGGMTSLGGSFLTTNNAAVYGVLAGTFSGMLNWTGGSISGGSSLTVASNGVLNINPGGSTTLNLYGVLTNYGTVNWLSGNIQILNNNNPGSYTGGINNMAGGAFNVQCDRTIYEWEGYEYFINAGTFTKVQSTNITYIDTAFTNSGNVTAIEGTVGFNNSLSLTNGLLEFAISSPTNFGQITVSGTANLAGGVGALLLNGYVPAIGTQFNVMTFGSESGAFTDYSGLNAGGGIVFNPTVTATTVTLQAAATNFFGVTPYIVTQPTGQTVNYNSTAMLNVVVSGSAPLLFQWKQNGVPVPAGTNATLTLSNVLVSQAGTYTVAVTNSAGGVVSQPVQLTVIPALPVLTWTNPAAISYGTPLGTNQLNASANLPGTFAYCPPAGTVLSAGGSTLSVTFTPTDSVDYTSVSGNASISVSQIPLRVAANNASRTYGQANPVFTGTITGLTNADNISATYNCSAVPISPPGTYGDGATIIGRADVIRDL